jgi:hypothetical protein
MLLAVDEWRIGMSLVLDEGRTECRWLSVRDVWNVASGRRETLEMVYQDSCPKYYWVQQTVISSILLCPTHYCVQQFTVSGKILCPHLFLIYTCLTFPCWHAASYHASLCVALFIYVIEIVLVLNIAVMLLAGR